ncbi:hypothetical protein [Halalkalibacterium halodurans]|uniref:hypothetical protein n=1 Tax=Halalkalibacterium halodurans TaxID=86665 RepID=UPI002AAA5D8F|nr:hypothetical protein [Halalkalibacterium halodurans]MDY7224649.1 hypothetical protein [Halalkalibacterium halodurans]MDY7243244.1 hypothetical protein [Halalkalibacterium halodurans]
MEPIKSLEHICNGCGAKLLVPEVRCKDGMKCPACSGHLALTGNAETIAFFADGNHIENQTPLLIIELQDENSVPVVKLNGEKIEQKQKVEFSWLTKTQEPVSGGLMYNIKHIANAKGRFGIKTTKYEHGEFAFEREF